MPLASGVDRRVKVVPVWIGFGDKIELPGLERFLARDRVIDPVVPLDINQPDETVPAAEIRSAPQSMLRNPRREIRCDADIERTARPIGHDTRASNRCTPGRAALRVRMISSMRSPARRRSETPDQVRGDENGTAATGWRAKLRLVVGNLAEADISRPWRFWR